MSEESKVQTERPLSLTFDWGDEEWGIFDLFIQKAVFDVRHWEGAERTKRIQEWSDLIEGAIEQNVDELDEQAADFGECVVCSDSATGPDMLCGDCRALYEEGV